MITNHEKNVYENWIKENVDGNGYGRCAEITLAMLHDFPELKRIRGHYYCAIWGERTHWWLINSDGDIIDPTKNQFPSGGLGAYVELDESQPQPIGICANCGGKIYSGQGDGTVCSEACFNSYVAYLNSGH